MWGSDVKSGWTALSTRAGVPLRLAAHRAPQQRRQRRTDKPKPAQHGDGHELVHAWNVLEPKGSKLARKYGGGVNSGHSVLYARTRAFHLSCEITMLGQFFTYLLT